MTPRYAFDATHALRGSLLRKLLPCRRIILLSDFDGTLAPIRPTPAEARMPARTRKLLYLLSNHPSITVGIVTGRSLPDIRRKVGKSHMLLVANHGFEIFFDRLSWVHPWAERAVPLLRQLALRLRKQLRPFSGVLVENKRYTLSVHYRSVPKRDVRRMREVVLDFLLPFWKDFRITEGKKVVELRPNVPWDKGTAIQRVLTLLKREKHGCVIYIGDDTTDEDAFETLRGGGITVVVGRKKQSRAAYWVRDPAEVWEFLAALAITLAERSKP